MTEKNESFNVTAEHPIWLQGKGWTQAKDIKRADPIATQTGDILVLQNTRINQPLKVYNFSVANTPNYFVGKQGIWVHNAGNECDIYGGGRVPTKPTNPPNIREAAQSWPPAKKARFDLADQFFKDTGRTGYDNDLRGIDFDKPVEIVGLSKGDKVYRYTEVNTKIGAIKRGRYYTDKKDTPKNTLGIDPVDSNPLEDVQIKQVEYTVDEPTNVLKSTAADIDSWTANDDRIFSGGGTQLYQADLNYASKKVL